jgi:hypothetical protein
MTRTATASTQLVFSERDLDAHGVLSRKNSLALAPRGEIPIAARDRRPEALRRRRDSGMARRSGRLGIPPR